ncbi:hypothetical protein [Oenococcus oeni]|uniref:hypothetical protein n=1 Tax=Oenococcus oeni TaxID=1247 RepID=UPI000A4F9E43|nr:hypothetical protein [Oenococcus oeni]
MTVWAVSTNHFSGVISQNDVKLTLNLARRWLDGIDKTIFVNHRFYYTLIIVSITHLSMRLVQGFSLFH